MDLFCNDQTVFEEGTGCSAGYALELQVMQVHLALTDLRFQRVGAFTD